MRRTLLPISFRPIILATATLACATVAPPGQTPAPSACFESAAGPTTFGAGAERGYGPSLLILERFDLPLPLYSSGPARLQGQYWLPAEYSAQWQLAGDSVVVSVQGQLGVWEYRMRVDTSHASGWGLTTTDQLQFDSAGIAQRVTDRWDVSARRVSCPRHGAS